MHGAAVAALCLLLIAPPSTLHLKQGDLHPPLAAPPQRELRGEEESAPLDAKQTCRCDLNRSCTLELRICCVLTAVCVCVWASSDDSLDKGNAKVGLFIAACVGTFALIAAVYCIYTKFYSKQQYLHTQLNNDSGKCVWFLECC